MAQQWHPDKYQGDLPKDTVLKKMSDINEAYETLTDDGMWYMVLLGRLSRGAELMGPINGV